MNSTLKKGSEAGIFNFIHRVFNLWKKMDPVYNPYMGRNVENLPPAEGPVWNPKGRPILSETGFDLAKNGCFGPEKYGCGAVLAKR